MSSLFEDRLKSFETKFQYEQEFTFKINSLAARMLALWSASQIGITPDQLDDYIDEVIDAELQGKGFTPLIDKIYTDLQAKGIVAEKEDVLRVFHEKVTLARHQLSFEVH